MYSKRVLDAGIKSLSSFSINLKVTGASEMKEFPLARAVAAREARDAVWSVRAVRTRAVPARAVTAAVIGASYK